MPKESVEQISSSIPSEEGKTEAKPDIYGGFLRLQDGFRDARKEFEAAKQTEDDTKRYFEDYSEECHEKLLNARAKLNEAIEGFMSAIENSDDAKIKGLAISMLSWFFPNEVDQDTEIKQYFDYSHYSNRLIQAYDTGKTEGERPKFVEVLMYMAERDERDTPEKKDAMIKIIRKFIPEIERESGDGSIPSMELAGFLKAFAYVLKTGSEEEKGEVLDILEKDFKNDSKATISTLASFLSAENEPETIAYATNLLRGFLKECGIEERYADAWAKDWSHIGTKNFTSKYTTLLKNIEALRDLEKEEAGITAKLYENYGISNFGRYPKKMLIRQYKNDTSEDPDQKYGTIFYPRADWNGAFHEGKEAFEKMQTTMDQDPILKEYIVRIFEVRSGIKIIKDILPSLAEKYPKHEASFVIFGGHGTEGSIQMGGNGRRGVIATEDLTPAIMEKVKSYFKSPPPVAVIACSAGGDEEKGIGKTLSRTANTEVTAPKTPTNVKSIGISFDPQEKRINLAVEYTHEGAARTFIPQRGASQSLDEAA